MKKHQLMLCAMLVAVSFGSALSQELTQAHKDSLRAVVQDYYDISLEIYSAGSTPADVDRLFALFTDDFVYVHPKYGGTYPRTDLYEGYLRNQKNGAYNGTITDLQLSNLIVGLNAVATERLFLKKEPDGTLSEVDPGMTLFEFRDGKISKIFEYW